MRSTQGLQVLDGNGYCLLNRVLIRPLYAQAIGKRRAIADHSVQMQNPLRALRFGALLRRFELMVLKGNSCNAAH
jgi:hypothetical protein